MSIDIDELQSFCEFGTDRVYLLMAIARAKENAGSSHNDLPVLREVVEDEAELSAKVDQLAHAVSRFDEQFRLYLSVNARNTLTAFFDLRERMDDWIEMRLNGNKQITAKFKQVDSEYKSVLQSDACKDETYFIFDVDDATAADAKQLRERLTELTTVSLVRETPNGYHLVTEPFNYNDLTTEVAYELKTDGMVFVSFLG